MLNSVVPFGLVWALLLYKDNDNSIMLIDKAESVKIEDIVTEDNNVNSNNKTNSRSRNAPPVRVQTEIEIEENIQNRENRDKGDDGDDDKNQIPHYHVEYILGAAEFFRKSSDLIMLLQQYVNMGICEFVNI